MSQVEASTSERKTPLFRWTGGMTPPLIKQGTLAMARLSALRDISRVSQMREPFLSARHRQFFAAVLELTYVVRA